VKSKLFSQFSWILAGRIIAAALQAATVAILARLLGPQQFGVLAVVLGVIIWLQAVADLGMAKLVVRERAAGNSADLVAGGLWINSRSTLILSIVLGLAFIGGGLAFDESLFLMLPLAVSAAGEKNADTWLGVAIADGDTHLNSLNLVGRRTIALTGFLTLNSLDISPMLSYSSAVAVAAITSVIFARRHVSKLEISARASFAETISTARPFWMNTLAVQLRNLDAMVVGVVANASAVGYYATASKLSGPLNMLPTSLSVVILPHAARTRRESLSSIVKIVFLAGSLVGLIYLSLVFIIPWLIPTVLGHAYIPAIVPLQIVLVGLIFAAFSSLFGAVLQGRGLPREVATIAVCATIYLMVALAVLGSIFGAVGAALALASSYAVDSLALGAVFILKVLRKTGEEN